MEYEGRNDYNGYAPSSTTTTEYNPPEQQYFTQPVVEPNQNYDIQTDDYSVNSNFEEQKNYNINYRPVVEENPAEPQFMLPPTIEREKKVEEVVMPSFTKSRQKLYIGGRMKIVISAFSIIMTALIVAIIWNLFSISKLTPMLLQKENQINELQTSISSLTDEYNLLDSESYLKMRAEDAGFIEADGTSTKRIKLEKMHKEEKPYEVKSNWFNDVCDFLSNIFG